MADPAALLAIQIANTLPESRRAEFHTAYVTQKKDRTTALLLSLFLGWGIDRFYLGQVALGLLKLVTAGGCGLWYIIDWFIITSAADQYNIDLLQRLQQLYGASAQPQIGAWSHVPTPSFGPGYPAAPAYPTNPPPEVARPAAMPVSSASGALPTPTSRPLPGVFLAGLIGVPIALFAFDMALFRAGRWPLGALVVVATVIAILVAVHPSFSGLGSRELLRRCLGSAIVLRASAGGVGVTLMASFVLGGLDLRARHHAASLLSQRDPCYLETVTAGARAEVADLEPSAYAERTAACGARRKAESEAKAAEQKARDDDRYLKACLAIMARLDSSETTSPTDAELASLQLDSVEQIAVLKRITSGKIISHDLSLPPENVPCRGGLWRALVRAAASSPAVWTTVTSASDVSDPLRAQLFGAPTTSAPAPAPKATSGNAATPGNASPGAVTAPIPASSNAQKPENKGESTTTDRTACLRKCIAGCRDDPGCERLCATQQCH